MPSLHHLRLGNVMTASKPLRVYSSALQTGRCLVGTFRLNTRNGIMVWSDQMYAIHGYGRGEIVPTLAILIAHKSAEDQDQSIQLWNEACTTGSRFCNYHRIVDVTGKERHVMTSAESIYGPDGGVIAVRGYMVDLSSTIQQEIQEAARTAVERADTGRRRIERAVGLLMAYFRIDADTALAVLMRQSNNTNTKLSALAFELTRQQDYTVTERQLENLITEVMALTGGGGQTPHQ